ncbi:MAG: hypothetical protein KGP12_02975 [Actinomycetales bacterium]|nr:hypothetical protein [Actinomycetales bacterium]
MSRGVVGFLALCLVATTACAGSPTSPDKVGTLRYEDGVAHITVPALWAGQNDQGEMVGGVEPAEIAVSTAGVTPEYAVDLADIEAQGAGDAWQAATSMAAALATA